MVRNNTYNKLLNQAKVQVLDEIKITSDDIENITTNLQYVHNWNGFTKKFSDIFKEDNIVMIDNDKEYKFSKKHFLTNKFFIKELTYNLKNLLGNVYVKTIIKDNDLIVKIMKNRRSNELYNKINYFVN